MSGLVRGIDVEAHRGYISAGRTIAVFGTGVDDALCSTGTAALAADGAQILHIGAEARAAPGCRAHSVGVRLSRSLGEELAGRAAGYG